ncbi:helix-turn-helix transcriptional regulator [Castellaniella ginsengisoli]
MAQATTFPTTRIVTKAQAAQPVTADDRLIADREVAHLIGASRSWPWKLARDGRFPKPIKLSARCTRWRLSDVRAWMANPMAWQAGEG